MPQTFPPNRIDTVITTLPHNIEKSTYRFPREYIGYADGVWHIRRASSGKGWLATKLAGKHATRYGSTLTALGATLDLYARRTA